MKHLIYTITLLLFSITVNAQSTIEDYVNEGIKYHDSGDYDKAIETYKKALDIDANSPLVHYEIALSYFHKGDYKEAIAFSDNVLKQKGAYMLQAYLTKGSSLDNLGKTKESIKLFEKAIDVLGADYLLHYNLGLNHYKISAYDDAEEHVIKAIGLNSNHASSHLMLAYIHDKKRNTIQSLMALHYFLFLEPDSGRSPEAYDLLMDKTGGNVTKDATKPNTINISLSPNNDSQFGAAELMLSLLEASKTTEKNEDKTDDEMFVENTKSFFTVLGELKENNEKASEIWWTFYTPFYYSLAKSEHIETYCKYITQCKNDASKTWLADNDEKLISFDAWLQTN